MQDGPSQARSVTMTVNARATSSPRPSASNHTLMEQLEPRWLASATHHLKYATGHHHYHAIVQPVPQVRYSHRIRIERPRTLVVPPWDEPRRVALPVASPPPPDVTTPPSMPPP